MRQFLRKTRVIGTYFIIIHCRGFPLAPHHFLFRWPSFLIRIHFSQSLLFPVVSILIHVVLLCHEWLITFFRYTSRRKKIIKTTSVLKKPKKEQTLFRNIRIIHRALYTSLHTKNNTDLPRYFRSHL